MTQGTNAVSPFIDPNLRDLADSIGITQFQGADKWYQTIGGILIQGGLVTGVGSGATVVVPFNVGFPTQVLGVFVQALGTSVLGWSVNNITTAQFELVNAAVAARSFNWWAIGV
jgi:hypothetical protein